VPTVSGKDKFFAELETLIAKARELQSHGFDEQEPEAATCNDLIRPFLDALGFRTENIKPEFKILGDSVDYLLKSARPLMFVEAKSLLDCWGKNLFDKHREQVHRYIQNYRLSPEITAMEQPVKWILLTNFAQLHFIRVNEVTPSFSFKLDDLWKRREELWELLALENLEANRIDEIYDQHKRADLDQMFLADLKRWRLLIANGFALRNPKRSLDEITLASQQLLDRFIFCLMLETQRLVEFNKLARTYSNYEVLFARADKTFGEVLRESLFVEIKNDFNTELFEQPLLCDELNIDNAVLSAVIGHEPLAPELAAQCGFESGQGELLAFRHLYRYDFSLMSSDVMGAVYERFLAHKLFQDGGRVVIEDTDELRKKEGIYYTPQYIVDYIVAHTLGEKIKPVLAGAKTLLGYKNFKGAIAKIRELGEIKVLDPAMGSGSFLLRAFDALVKAYDDYNQECRRIKKDRNGHGALFDADLVIAEEVLDAPLHVLTENIFGVDLDKQAVEVAKLNLWLRYMAVNRDPFLERIRRKQRGGQPLSLLPNLTKNFKRGNSLIADKAVAGDAAFDWEKEFPQVFQGRDAALRRPDGPAGRPYQGGFDVVIGNPPYVVLNVENCDKAAIDFFQTFPVAEFKIDLFHLFIQRDIVPNPWLTLQYTSKLRHYVLDKSSIQELVVFSHRVFQDADVHTCLLLVEKGTARKDHLVAVRHPAGIDIESAEQSHVTQSSWCHPPAYVMETRLTGEEKALIERLVSQFPRLQSLARASLGCQAYNSSKHTAEQIENRVFHSDHKAGPEYLPELAGNDVSRYEINRQKGEWIKYGPWLHDYRTMDWLEGPRILIREIPGHPPYMIQACYVEETYCHYKTILNVNPLPDSKLSMKFLTGLLNSRLLSFVFPFISNKMVAQSFPRLSVGDIKNLPIAPIDFSKTKEKANHDQIASLTDERLSAEAKRQKIPLVIEKKIHHSQNRTPCNLAHYLQKDFAAAVTEEKLIDDVQRTGFVHEIRLESEGSQITLSAVVAAGSAAVPAASFGVPPNEPAGETPTKTRGTRVLPILRLTFKDEALRQFIYASWRQFLNENSRKQKWIKGKKPEPIYPLLVNTLEPLVYFNASAGDNLRAIRDLMKAVATEAGSADLAAIESEIKTLDAEIDTRVYDLYGLTEAEVKIVEGAAK
jgi:type I restriction-modification system DNA methylase subunit